MRPCGSVICAYVVKPYWNTPAQQNVRDNGVLCLIVFDGPDLLYARAKDGLTVKELKRSGYEVSKQLPGTISSCRQRVKALFKSKVLPKTLLAFLEK